MRLSGRSRCGSSHSTRRSSCRQHRPSRTRGRRSHRRTSSRRSTLCRSQGCIEPHRSLRRRRPGHTRHTRALRRRTRTPAALPGTARRHSTRWGSWSRYTAPWRTARRYTQRHHNRDTRSRPFRTRRATAPSRTGPPDNTHCTTRACIGRCAGGTPAPGHRLHRRHSGRRRRHSGRRPLRRSMARSRHTGIARRRHTCRPSACRTSCTRRLRSHTLRATGSGRRRPPNNTPGSHDRSAAGARGEW